jgi:hypothetical protein
MAAPSRHPAARPVPQTDDYATRTPGGFTDPASGARVLKTRGLFRLRAQPLAGPPVGRGWGIVSNDRVNLSSSPLFTVLLLLVLRVGSIGLAQVLSLVFACAGLAVTYLATRAMTSSVACGLGALVVAAANVHLWRWSGTMMETSLGYLSVTVIALTTLMLIRSKSESIWQLALLGLFTALGTEVRFEIGLLLPLSFLALWFSRREERGLPRQPLNHPATPRPTPLPMLKSDGPLTAALRLDTPQPAARHFSRSRQFRPSMMLHWRTTRS